MTNQVIYIGIDPGMSGAICVRIGDRIEFYDIPTKKVNGKSDIDFAAMAKILQPFQAAYRSARVFVCCEKSMGMAFTRTKFREPHHDDSTTAWKKGYCYGVIRTMFHAYNLPFTATPQPSVWKRDLKLSDGKLTYHQKKEKSRLEAIRLFPDLKDKLKRKKDADRAEALLLSLWIERKRHYYE